jgi:hypothetical protein
LIREKVEGCALFSKQNFSIILSLALTLLSGTLGAQDATVGSVKTASGEAFVIRTGQTLSATIGLRLSQGDLLRTADGSLGVILRDDSVLSLGPDSELVIDEFVFSPGEGNLSLLLRLIKGTAAFLSGQISKLSPNATTLETPVATIGVRGTRFAVKVDPK